MSDETSSSPIIYITTFSIDDSTQVVKKIFLSVKKCTKNPYSYSQVNIKNHDITGQTHINHKENMIQSRITGQQLSSFIVYDAMKKCYNL